MAMINGLDALRSTMIRSTKFDILGYLAETSIRQKSWCVLGLRATCSRGASCYSFANDRVYCPPHVRSNAVLRNAIP